MRLIYDDQLIIEKAKDNRFIVYSPMNHRWIKINQYMYDLIKMILEDNGYIDQEHLKDFFAKKYQIELTDRLIEEQIEKLTESEVFFHNREGYMGARDKRIKDKDRFLNPKIKQAYLHPTLNCNFQCSYCYNQDIKTETSQELSTSQWIEVIESLKDKGVTKFVFTGGEPLLNKDLEEIIKATKRPQIDFILITNGSLLKDRFDSLVPLLEKVSISFDSFDKQINTQNRSGFEFNQIIETIELFSKKAPEKLRIKTVITKHNYHQAQDFSNHLTERYGIENHPTWFIPRNVEEIKEIPEFNLTLQKKGYDKRFFKMHLIRCGACYSVIAIDPKGDIFPCQSLLFDRFKMGNMLTEHWYEAFLESKVRKDFLKISVDNMKTCQNCSYRYFCGGGCPAISYRVYDNPLAHLDFFCGFLKNIAQDVLINADVEWQDLG